ncbi:MarR family transcriptional regulator [Lysobacter sp. BMK333-48F3]|uniref:MarR family winged helix-turn-helix transcriptional regulator n=1 Tax=Lysobacter sp. BMK333-48F3 TaxID=2867962 RepID=UPI001C8BC423|nr:MarR family transcriptional regulator [Lysobacter sp. BMK333-48F3]MBX9400553.1 MarR family transcriptional regulator [Lysobacter sp. BMK333-48F3]
MAASRDIDILNLVNTVAHQATAGMQRALREAELGLVAMEARTLRFVARHPGCTQNDIVRESGRDKAQIARVIKALLDRGEIRRLADEPGEKRLRLQITDAGAATHRHAESLRGKVAQSLLRGLDAGERRSLQALLQRMTEAEP